MHHKTFGGRAPPEPAGKSQSAPHPPEPLAGFREWAPEREGRERESKGGETVRWKGRESPLLRTDRSHW